MTTSTDAFDYPAAFSAARAVISKHRPLALQAQKPLDELARDLASHIWDKRSKWDPERGAFSTWATRVCWGRLMDLVDATQTHRAQAFVTVREMPEPAKPKKSELSVTRKLDVESRLASLAYISRHLAAATIPPRSPKDRSPFYPSQLAAILALKMDRKDTLRGVIHRLNHSASLRDELELRKETLPSWMVLWRASLTWWGKPKRIRKLLDRTLSKMEKLEKEIEP